MRWYRYDIAIEINYRTFYLASNEEWRKGGGKERKEGWAERGSEGMCGLRTIGLNRSN